MAIGLNILEGDYIIEPGGQVEAIDGTRKTSRDFKKMLMTDVSRSDEGDTSRYNPDYGSKLNSKDALVDVPRNVLIDTVNIYLTEAIGYYIQLQEQRSNLSIEEIITGVDYLTYFDPTNSQRIMIDITVGTGTGEELTVGGFEQEV